jgi:hypothetical protein
MLGSLRVLGACGAAAIVVLLLGGAFGASDVSRLSLAESSAMYGAGGNCHYMIFGSWGCTLLGCTQEQNAEATLSGGPGKAEARDCTYTKNGDEITCGSKIVSVKCSP